MIRRLIQSRVIRHISTLVSGKLGAALITFIGTPIVSRLFAPEDFGIVSVFVALTTILGGIASLNYQRAILLSMSDRRSYLLASLSFRLLAGVTLLLYLLLVIQYLVTGELFMQRSLGNWVWLLPIAVWLTSASLIGSNMLAREKKYKAIAVAAIAQSASTVGGRISLGWLAGSTIWGLLVSQFAGLIVNLIVIWSRLRQQKSRPRLTARKLRAVVSHYKDFPLYNMPAALMNSLSSKLPILLLGPWLGMSVVGYYAMAHRLIGMPLNLVGNSVRMVVLQKVSEVREQGGSLLRLYILGIGAFSVAGALPFSLLWFYGEVGLVFFLGDQWLEAGRYVEILAPWYFATWVGALVPSFMISLRKQGLWLGLQSVQMAGRLAAFGYAYLVNAGAIETLHILVWVNVAIVCLSVLTCFFQVSKASIRPLAAA